MKTFFAIFIRFSSHFSTTIDFDFAYCYYCQIFLIFLFSSFVQLRNSFFVQLLLSQHAEKKIYFLFSSFVQLLNSFLFSSFYHNTPKKNAFKLKKYFGCNF